MWVYVMHQMYTHLYTCSCVLFVWWMYICSACVSCFGVLFFRFRCLFSILSADFQAECVNVPAKIGCMNFAYTHMTQCFLLLCFHIISIQKLRVIGIWIIRMVGSKSLEHLSILTLSGWLNLLRLPIIYYSSIQMYLDNG